jgi:uncharacterized protein (TIGR02646 family)
VRHVDRSIVNPPAAWRRSAAAAHKRAEKYFRTSPDERSQSRYEFDTKISLQIGKLLDKLFLSKCAYCESTLGAVGGEIEHFRPTLEATDWQYRKKSRATAVESDPDAYWWLVYEWSNLLLSCLTCARNKRNYFPVKGKRATAPPAGAKDLNSTLKREHPLLLNPCVDYPGQFLVFNNEGLVHPRRPPSRGRKRMPQADRADILARAGATIELLALNRTALVGSRLRELKELKAEWELMTALADGKARRAALARMMAPSRPHAGMRMQFLTAWVTRLREATRQRNVAGVTRKIVERAASPGSTPPRDTGAPREARRQPKTPARRRRASVRVKPTRLSQVESIHITNFRAIHDLKLTFPLGTSLEAGWIVLLGENGAGKSSALQAIALALMGREHLRDYMREFKLRPSHLLRRIGRKTADTASVMIRLRNDDEFGFSITKQELTFVAAPPPGLFLRAYGSTRLLPRRNQRRPSVKIGVEKKISNLLDPVRPVVDANRWIAQLKSQEFGTAALALKDLLDIPLETNLSVQARRVLIPLHGGMQPLDELSAGYESILAAVADIMAGVLRTVRDLRKAAGIVLIDEIDAHLHPRWKLRIVKALRKTFSSIQFVVTTHEPLCLRGVKEHEVALLKRDGDEVAYLTELPSPSELRIDQLLTSELFGLYTALDPDVDAKFQAYYALLAKGNDLTTSERKTLEDLKSQLPAVELVQMLGDSKREQLIYEAVDQHLASRLPQRNNATAGDLITNLAAADEDVKQRIAAIWNTPTEAL